jgi:O-antigen ligase
VKSSLTIDRHRPVLGPWASEGSLAARPELPRWPFVVMFLGFPVWWVLGIGDIAWVVLAVVMTYYLVKRRQVSVPRGFGIWLLFLVWMLFSVVEIDTGGRLIGFVYRVLLYLATTVIFIYVYNARRTLTSKYVAGTLTAFWLIIVAGGYLGVLLPLLSFRTPLYYILPKSILSNELVQEMAVRRVTQFNPDSWLQLDPRPSAPFLYTNGWGNTYSMLIPIVIAYIFLVRKERKFWPLLIAVPVSLVPAVLTLNRGMLLGLGIALVYVAIRLFLRGNVRALIAIALLAVVVGGVFTSLGLTERISDRTTVSSSTEDRANLYEETYTRTLESPVFGYGAPRPSSVEGAPSDGTQGQFWMVLFSFGFPGAIFFMAWLIWAYLRSLSNWDPVGLAANTALLVAVVESFYYGLLTAGLAIAMIAAALTMRPQDPPPVLDSLPPRTKSLRRPGALIR